jgi:peptide/bleomycin uptake transporter
MIKSFFCSRKWALWAWGGISILLISMWIQVSITVMINEWYGGFYDLMQRSADYVNNPQVGIDLFYEKLISFKIEDKSFFILAIPFMILQTITDWFTRYYGLRWREAITFDYMPQWYDVEEEIEGASQRIQEDIKRYIILVENLGLNFIRTVMTLIAFIPLLWTLSDQVQIPMMGGMEGGLVWLAFGVSVGGLVITWIVGSKLPGLEYNNQKVEAAFRKELVYAEDDKTNYAKPDTIWELFTGIKFNYQILFNHYAYVETWINSYNQFMVIVPYLLVGGGLFTKLITLGIVVQVSNAFGKVHEGLAFFLFRFTMITELRSIWKRLSEFEANLERFKRV